MSHTSFQWPLVRVATVDDADAAARVLRQSIIHLCQLDYADQPGRLEQWLANKTSSHVQNWISQDGFTLYVAEQERGIVGVGGLNNQGIIQLNYVDPHWRLRGVSSALLLEMETSAREAGNSNTTLESTRTAERFYRARGYNTLAAQQAPRDGLWLTKALT
ncbi:GNAT family N-acetyltransferase [Ahrensia marina]|uniref:GNAT family N-acetyltransferase n=1 Tax=Ahrensia marina TaxID=1514904 RepID=UPI0035D0B72E